MTRDEKKAEAIKRMKLADIFPQTIKQFEEDGYVSISEPMAYVYNHDMPDCSEFGCIGTRRSIAAGLLRTW